MIYKHLKLAMTASLFLYLLAVDSGCLAADVYAKPLPGVIEVGILENWPPQYSIDPETGHPAGFAVDIMEAVARRSQLEIRYQVYASWPEAAQAFEEKEIVIIPNVGITDERMQIYNFTAPVETTRISCFVRTTTSDIKGVDDLKGRKVGVVEFNKGLNLMQQRGGSDLTIFPALEQALFALIAGEVDALIYPEKVVFKMIQGSGLDERLKVVGQPLLEIKRAIGVSKDQPELLTRLDSAVKALLKSKEYQQIYNRWHTPPEPYWNVKRSIILMGSILLLTAAILSIWRYASVLKLNRTLKNSIAERESIAAALQASEEKYSSFIEQVSDGVVVIQDGRICFANHTFAEMTGYHLEELYQKLLWDLGTPEHQGPLRSKYENRIRGENISLVYELAIRCQDGSEKPVELSANRIHYQGKYAVICVFRDISERKHAELEKLELENKLHQAYKMEAIGTLAGGIAHDFNNILGIIIGYTQMTMKSLPEGSNETTKLGKVLIAADRAKELVRQILTFSRKQEQQTRPVVFATIITEALALLRATIPVSIEILTDIEAEEEIVLADPTQLHQILINLITNAVQAMQEKGQIRISLKRTTLAQQDISHRNDMQPGPYLELTVSDAGHGIPAQIIERIFEPFFTTKEIDRGTGMGLAMVHGIITAHHGLIKVSSEPERGTTFRIYLPIADSAGIVAAKTAQELPGGTERILLVDDEPDLAELGCQMLENFGYEVVVSTNSRAALKIFLSHPEAFDLLVTDQTMPQLSGLELTQQIRLKKPKFPALICTGHSSKLDEITTEFRDIGILMKPFTRTSLSLAVRQVLEGALPTPSQEKSSD